MQPITIKIMDDEYILDKEINIHNDYITIELYAEKRSQSKAQRRLKVLKSFHLTVLTACDKTA